MFIHLLKLIIFFFHANKNNIKALKLRRSGHSLVIQDRNHNMLLC